MNKFKEEWIKKYATIQFDEGEERDPVIELDCRLTWEACTLYIKSEMLELIYAYEDLLERHDYKGDDEWHIKALNDFMEKIK